MPTQETGALSFKIRLLCACCFLACLSLSIAPLKPPENARLVPVAEGWAKNSVNTVIFRRNSLVTRQNMQYTAFYDEEQYVVLAKRDHRFGDWTIRRTAYKGDASDAHTAISLMVDGEGFLHVCWGHHNSPLNYARSIHPGGLQLGEKIPMTGENEDSVTYPEFYNFTDGNLLFFYRHGVSGNGDLIINRYDTHTAQWTRVQSGLIDGQGERNAYWQACVDPKGTIHISWVWRESSDVASNHDLCYARSKDGGKTWENARGEKYHLPIDAENAAMARRIPQNSVLINQTSMTTDHQGNPLIATYWRQEESGVPQYRLLHFKDNSWHTLRVSSRTTPFALSGGGTKRIPISRPQVLARKRGRKQQVFLVYRDSERDNKVSVAICDGFPDARWRVIDLTPEGVGSWEPTYDTRLWESRGILHLFVQKSEQIDREGLSGHPPEMVYVLQWDPS